jgi:hypothetical protein
MIAIVSTPTRVMRINNLTIFPCGQRSDRYLNRSRIIESLTGREVTF